MSIDELVVGKTIYLVLSGQTGHRNMSLADKRSVSTGKIVVGKPSGSRYCRRTGRRFCPLGRPGHEPTGWWVKKVRKDQLVCFA